MPRQRSTVVACLLRVSSVAYVESEHPGHERSGEHGANGLDSVSGPLQRPLLLPAHLPSDVGGSS